MKAQKVTMSESSDLAVMSKYEFSILNHIKMRLSDLGWNLVFDRAAEEAKCFENLIPLPTITFSVVDTAAGERRAVAFHFYESGDDIHYVCTMHLPDNGHAQERGQFNKDAETLTILTTHDEWLCPRPKLSSGDTAISVISLKKPLESIEDVVASPPNLVPAKGPQSLTVRARKGRKAPSAK